MLILQFGLGMESLVANIVYEAAEFLDTQSYKHLNRWTQEIASREAVKRGRMVNKPFGEPETQLHERHDASDFDTKTQDKIELSNARELITCSSNQGHHCPWLLG